MGSRRDRVRALADRYFPLVERVARRVARHLPAQVQLDDLISAGFEGLMDAAKRFDPTRTERFETFAEPRIRGAMLDDLRARDTLSRDMRRLLNEVREVTRSLEAELGRTATPDEIARKLGITVEAFYARQKKLSGATVIGIDDVAPGLLARTPSVDTFEDPFAVAARLETAARLATALDALPARPRQVISLLYAEGMTLREIARVFGVTESRVCQIHREGIALLRTALVATGQI